MRIRLTAAESELRMKELLLSRTKEKYEKQIERERLHTDLLQDALGDIVGIEKSVG